MQAAPIRRVKRPRSPIERRITELQTRLVAICQDIKKPEPGWLPPEEHEFQTVEEMRFAFDMFWSKKLHQYGPDYFRLDPHRDNYHVKGNTAVVAVFLINQKSGGHMFAQKRILSPFERKLTRQQWWQLLPTLTHKEAMWVWLPAIIKETKDEGWDKWLCFGWDIYHHRFPILRDDDVILGPEGALTRQELNAREPKWKGISMFQDILDGQSVTSA